MTYYNNAVSTKRELLLRLIQLLNNDELFEKIDRIPLEMRPRTNSPIRCCVHKDRAVLKYKIMAILGFNVADETDELMPLYEYAIESLNQQTQNGHFLTVVDEACSSCVQVNYTVSNLCQGCEGRACQVNCPKDAIQVINGKAHIDDHKCVSCGLCQKACPFHAIAYLPVPCEESCPVNAIRKNENGIEEIDFDKCIHCGKCMKACPFGAVAEKSQLMNLFYNLKTNQTKMVAMIAPAILSQFKAPAIQILKAIKKIGFDIVMEVAEGAELTTKNETEELHERLKDGAPFMTTSCCPSYVELTKKHLKPLHQYVSHTPSPMAYTAEKAGKLYPKHKTVFIGPCLAKRKEAYNNENVDYVLTTEELGVLIEALQIDINKMEGNYQLHDEISAESRGYAASGGVTNAIKSILTPGTEIKSQIINGIDKKSIKLLKAYTIKSPNASFIEVMACDGGCINGPVNNAPINSSQVNLKKAMEEIKTANLII